jgi:hypothetical protein
VAPIIIGLGTARKHQREIHDMEIETKQASVVGVAKTIAIDVGARHVSARRAGHGSTTLRNSLLIGLIAVILLALVGCTSSVSTTTPRSPTAAAATPAAAATAPTVAATIAATAPATPTAILPTPTAAQATPAELGARVPVPLDVAQQFRSGRLAEPAR